MAKKQVKKEAAVKSYNPHESMVIQAGVIVIIVSAIAIFAYTYSVYGIN